MWDVYWLCDQVKKHDVLGLGERELINDIAVAWLFMVCFILWQLGHSIDIKYRLTIIIVTLKTFDHCYLKAREREVIVYRDHPKEN